MAMHNIEDNGCGLEGLVAMHNIEDNGCGLEGLVAMHNIEDMVLVLMALWLCIK